MVKRRKHKTLLNVCRLSITSTVLFLVLLSGCSGPIAKSPADLHKEKAQWFQDAKFGLFIHWGIYSIPEKGEWVMHNDRITKKDYEKLAPKFNPVLYDPAEWVKIAKDAGCRYITITSKHHDGFAMWDSKVTDWDIVDRTPYGKDILKMLADECQKQNMPLFFYHSHLDWNHTDYFPRGRTGTHTGRPEQGNFNKYLDFMNAQIAELCSGRYGKVAGFWFDGWWDQQIERTEKKTSVDWRLEKTYNLIHRLQPQALIGNNHHVQPFPGENFQMFERGVPGKDKFSEVNFVSPLPLETCDTINGSWGYNARDKKFKSTTQLIHYLVQTAGYNANFLLNVGPMPDGRIQPQFVRRLSQIGQWLSRNGKSIYGTRSGPMPPQQWGVTTQKEDNIYVHILKVPADNKVTMPDMAGLEIQKAWLMQTGKAVTFNKKDNDLELKVPESSIDHVDTIVVLKLETKQELKS
ncbi:MAG: alpha-L-fucosidase [Planctomycetota bacterium]|jgi:alpha-L-fucosidase